jgi:hypothetical protein
MTANSLYEGIRYVYVISRSWKGFDGETHAKY